jgi:hypothetical protein
MLSHPHLRLVPLVGSLLAFTAPASLATVPDGWFEWPYVEARPGSAVDTSPLNHKPAGSRGQVIVRDGIFVTANDGQRIRFWGCNLSSNEAFPDSAGADRMARRLAQGGINIARLHHLDNPWSVDSAGSLWTPGSQDRINIDPQQLDKLHRLVAALKAEGVYSNVNLKVSRTHTVEDGFPPSISQTPAFQKRLDYFQRRIVDLQKDYARQLLTTVNPYTGLSLAEDPAVAAVELNNENSLLGLRTRDIADGLEQLPEPFLGELTALWNTWLTQHYSGDRELAAAWAADATPLGESPLTPSSRWHPDAQPGNEVRVVSPDPTEVHLQVEPGDGVRWRSAAYLNELRLIDNATYTLTFSARADRDRPVDVTVSRDEPLWRTDKWRTRGLRQTLRLTSQWQTYRLVFTTHSIVDVPSRLSFIAGHMPGEIWVRDLKLESGSTAAGLRPGQSAWDGTVPIPTDATPNQWNDYLSFLVDTEKAYVAEMMSYLRDELRVRAPIVCTQANYGGIAGLVREQPSDFIDAHAYWQHPDFGGVAGTWDTGHYTINNTPQIGEFGPRWFGEIGGIALLRVTGKPFTVTEFDAPAPSDYAVEMYPLHATFGGLQDWDALYTFDMVGLADETTNSALRTFFDQSHHPAKWGFGPFAARVFRQGLIPPLQSTRELFVRAPFWDQANHVDVLWLKHQSGQDLGFLTDRLSVNENLLGPAERSHIVRRGASRLGAVRLLQTQRGVVYTAAAEAVASLIGYVGGATVNVGALSVETDSFGLNFAAVGVVALDEKPLPHSERILVTLAARAENQNFRWNAARTSVGEVWGEGGPTLAERVPATVRLQTQAPRRVQALAPDGSPAAEVKATWENGWVSFSTREGPGTLHYEVVP